MYIKEKKNLTRMLFSACVVLLMFGALLGGCSGKTNTTPTQSTTPTTKGTKDATTATQPTSISLNKTQLRIAVEYQLSATVEPSGSNQAVTWTSSDPSVATVDSTGLVKAIKKGQANISATSKSNSSVVSTCAVTVADVPTSKSSAHKPLDDNRGSLKECATCH